jgi:hypothetical protein
LGATGGRFWSLSSGEDSEDGDEGRDEDLPVEISLEALSAYCKTPNAESCTLPSSTSSAVRRREQKRLRQRAAAMQLLSGTPDSLRSTGSPCSKFTPMTRKVQFQTPILSPTTFMLESFDASEWVMVQRRQRKNRLCRRRGVWPPARSDHHQISNYVPLGQLGSAPFCINDNVVNIGRIGHSITQINRAIGRIP